jgi:GrpB-like predicted nucleotidyltransferase (UPF0157 family)
VPQAVRVVAYDQRWPTLFTAQASSLRERLGDVALRIDHIGSTAVPGLAAKPIIDVQISVAAFEPLDAFRAPLVGLGYVFRADNTSGPSGTSASLAAPAAHTSTSAARGASASNSPCYSATSCAPTRNGRSATPR